MTRSLPISPKYRSPIYTALALQVVIGFFSMLFLDGGGISLICFIALVAFWGGAALLIWRRPQSPASTDIELIRFGYLPVVVISFFLVPFIWSLRGGEWP